jgi:Homeodomain-like domain
MESAMAATRYRVLLSAADRTRLTDLIAAGAAPARPQRHARSLLTADQSPAGPAWTDVASAAALQTSERTVIRVRRAWVNEDRESAVCRRPPRATRPRRLDGAQEAHLVTLVCSAPPDGSERCSLRLLARKAIELEITDGIAPNTVRAVLTATRANPG